MSTERAESPTMLDDTNIPGEDSAFDDGRTLPHTLLSSQHLRDATTASRGQLNAFPAASQPTPTPTATLSRSTIAMTFPSYPPYPPALSSYRGPFPLLAMGPPGPPPFPGYVLAPAPGMPPGFYQRYPVSAAYETGVQQGRREGYGAAVQDLRGEERLGAFRGQARGERGSGERGGEWGARVEIDVGVGRLQLADGRVDSTRSSRNGRSEGRSRRNEGSSSSKGSGRDDASRAEGSATPSQRARDQSSTRVQTSMQAHDTRSSTSSSKSASTINPGSSVSQRSKNHRATSSHRSGHSESMSTPDHFSFPDLRSRSGRSGKHDPILEDFARAKRNASSPPSRRSSRSSISKTYEHFWTVVVLHTHPRLLPGTAAKPTTAQIAVPVVAQGYFRILARAASHLPRRVARTKAVSATMLAGGLAARTGGGGNLMADVERESVEWSSICGR
ncbi:hypothetical protein LTR95_000662 [Oleoguttula sp. CCFEE 5521]